MASDISHCSLRQFSCLTVKKCIPITYMCDGDNDCADGSDEDVKQCTSKFIYKLIIWNYINFV